MPELVDVGDDTGFASLKINDVEVRIDVYSAFTTVNEIRELHQGQNQVFLAKVAEYIESLGFPTPSTFAANIFGVKISELALTLQKKTDDVLGSPAFTTSTPTISPTEN